MQVFLKRMAAKTPAGPAFYRMPIEGDPVKIAGTKSRPEFNGLQGEVVNANMDKHGRITVRIFDDITGSRGERVMQIQPFRLLPVRSSSTPCLLGALSTGEAARKQWAQLERERELDRSGNASVVSMRSSASQSQVSRGQPSRISHSADSLANGAWRRCRRNTSELGRASGIGGSSARSVLTGSGSFALRSSHRGLTPVREI